jgi:hypothetical protein
MENEKDLLKLLKEIADNTERTRDSVKTLERMAWAYIIIALLVLTLYNMSKV